MVLVQILRAALARVPGHEEPQGDHVECLNVIAGHAQMRFIDQDSDANGKPVDALLKVALPVHLPRSRARGIRALPVEQCSAAVAAHRQITRNRRHVPRLTTANCALRAYRPRWIAWMPYVSGDLATGTKPRSTETDTKMSHARSGWWWIPVCTRSNDSCQAMSACSHCSEAFS